MSGPFNEMWLGCIRSENDEIAGLSNCLLKGKNTLGLSGKVQLWMMHAGNGTAKSKKLVIVATIDQKIENTLGKQLSSPDYSLSFVRKGADVLSEILEKEVDLLILDLDLAGVMGIDILPVIRKMRPRLPIILITEDFTYRIRKLVAEQGVIYQALKPMSPNEAGAISMATERIMEKTAFAQLFS